MSPMLLLLPTSLKVLFFIYAVLTSRSRTRWMRRALYAEQMVEKTEKAMHRMEQDHLMEYRARRKWEGTPNKPQPDPDRLY